MIWPANNYFFRCGRRGLLRFLKCAAVAVFPVTALGSVGTAIAWLPSADASVTGYNIYYGTNSHAYSGMISAGNVTNATINNLQPDTTYFFSVKSHDDAGNEGIFSNEASFAGYAVTPTSGGLRVKTCPAALKLDQLLFSLAPGAPANARINPTNGVLSWLPGLTDANTKKNFTVILTDLTHPSASTQQTIVVTVSDFLKLMLASVPVQTGQTSSLPLRLTASDGLTNLEINLNWPGTKLLNPTVTFSAPIAGGSVQNQGTNLVVKLWTANGDLLTGTNVFAQINFQAAPGQTSAFLTLPVASVSAGKADGSVFANLSAEAGEAVVIGINSLMRSQFDTAHGRTLALYANPGIAYQLQYATNLAAPIAWQPLQNYQPTNLLQTVSLDSAQPVIFYRLMQP